MVQNNIGLMVAYLIVLILFGRVALMAWRQNGEVTNARLGLVLYAAAANIVLLTLLEPDQLAAGTWGWLFDRVALWTPLVWVAVIVLNRIIDPHPREKPGSIFFYFTEAIIWFFSWVFVFVWLFSVITLFLLQFEVFHFGTLVI